MVSGVAVPYLVLVARRLDHRDIASCFQTAFRPFMGMVHQTGMIAPMLAKALLDILEPAYLPCAHFAGACADACVWKPARGLVPCAFGGAIGALDDVRLITVTAEPGDPPDSTGYEGTPQDMVRNSLRIFHEAMRNGGFDRAGRPTPFRRNMRRILDAFWPNESLDAQLRKTWTTNAVLCPAEVSGGKHMLRVEQACAATYLARQIDLFPNAFVLALGGKARDRIQAAGFRFDAVGLHPSARQSDAVKTASWEAAARLFRGEPSDEGSQSEAAAPRGRSPRQPSGAFGMVDPTTATDIQAAINALPPSISDFFQRVVSHPDYDCSAGRMHLMVSFRGEKVGGMNRQAAHWYFSKRLIGNELSEISGL
ncbi:MAG: hypothetical protein ACK4GC_16065 [Paracoccaceae bacterium]